MSLLAGLHHVATLTADLDRLLAFYARVFDAPATLTMEEEGLRHAFIPLGPATFLHPFEIPGVNVPQGELPLFGRGRIDHLALAVPNEAAFWELRQRVLVEGAGDGEVTDIGPLLTFGLTDPDGLWIEVDWPKPGVPLDEAGRRANWRRVEPPEPTP